MRRIIISASDIATVIGRNPFKSVEEITNELCNKYNPNSNELKLTKTAIAEKLISNTNSAVVLENALSSINDSVKLVNSTDLFDSNTSTQSQKILTNLVCEIQKDETLTEDEKITIIDYSKTKINTTHGTLMESKTADLIDYANLNNQTNQTNQKIQLIELIEDNNYYTQQICKIGKNNYVIVGKIDRIEVVTDINGDTTRTLIEIKNRTKKLFKKIYERENIQIQTYLQVVGLDKAKLVEQYNSEIYTISVERDDKLWENILIELKTFCEKINAELN